MYDDDNHKQIYTSKSKSYYKTSNISIFNELQLKSYKYKYIQI